MSTSLPDFSQDFFTLLGLPQEYALDRGKLDAGFRQVQASVHPDKFAHVGEAEQRMAMQWSTRVNEAYQTLKHPLKRAQYMLQLRGIDPELNRNTAMPTEFLVEQMELREAVAEARADNDQYALEELRRTLKKAMHNEYAALSAELAVVGDPHVAADGVRRLMFHEKLLEEIDNALENS